jgi:hypothetical protein
LSFITCTLFCPIALVYLTLIEYAGKRSRQRIQSTPVPPIDGFVPDIAKPPLFSGLSLSPGVENRIVKRGVNLDVMAGIRVRTSTGFKSWEFNPRTLIVENGLPWMQAQDWLELYEMFDRPERATVLRDYLSIARRRP